MYSSGFLGLMLVFAVGLCSLKFKLPGNPIEVHCHCPC
jgi:hypothetical protein